MCRGAVLQLLEDLLDDGRFGLEVREELSRGPGKGETTCARKGSTASVPECSLRRLR
jgi:hypothetical protein